MDLLKIYDGVRYLVLLGSGLYDAIYNRGRYHIGEKSCVTNSINYNFARIRVDS